MPPRLTLTLNEAGYVVERSSATINRAVDRGLIKAERQDKTRLRRLGRAELRTLAVVTAVEKDLTPAGRRKIYAAMQELPADAHRLEIGLIELQMTKIDARIARRLRRLEAIKASVDRSNKEPLIKGTDIPVHVIAALARGQTTAEILQDYPLLTVEAIEAAVDYGQIYPRAGRPLPTRSLKRTLSDMASAGVWEVDGLDEPLSPRPMP